MSLGGFLISSQERVHQTKQLHHSLVLTQVLVTFQQEHELRAIAPYKSGRKTIGKVMSKG